MARYSIIVREHGSDHNVELCQVNSNPEAIEKKLREMKLTAKRSIFEPGKRKTRIPRYSFIQIVDHGDA